jgi:hypothetical protein
VFLRITGRAARRAYQWRNYVEPISRFALKIQQKKFFRGAVFHPRRAARS